MRSAPGLGAIFLTVFIDLLGFGLVLPFLAIEARDTFGVTAFTATLLASAYSLMQFLFVPVWGRLSDRVGRRPVLVWSIAATAVCMASLGASLAWGSSIAWVFAARILGGVATANLGTASAYIADVTSPEERTRGMSLIGIAFGLGFILGPGVGGRALARRGRGPPRKRAVLRGCVPQPRQPRVGAPPRPRVAAARAPRDHPPEAPHPLNVAAMRDAFDVPGVALCVLVNFLVIASFTNLDQTFTFFCGDLFGIDERGTGYVLAFIGVTAALAQGAIVRPLSKRVDDVVLLRAGVALQAAAVAGLGVAGRLGARPALYASGALLALGNGLTQPTTPAFISRRAPADRQGSALGTNQSFSSLARTVGPALGGWLYSNVGVRAPYGFASAGMLVALAMAMGLRKAGDRR